MAETTIQAAPVQAPAPTTTGTPQGATPQQEIARLNGAAIDGYINQGKAVGRAEGAVAEQERFRKIVAAAPGRPDIAVNAFLQGFDEKTVGMMFTIEQQAALKAQADRATQDLEIARLQQVIATGGHAGGIAMGTSSGGSSESYAPAGLEPEQQAKLEWDSDPMIRAKHGNKEKQYTLYRINQLKGNVQVLRIAK